MRYIYSFILLTVWSILGISCVGQKEEVLQENVKLTANRDFVRIGQDEIVNFQVYFNGLDVTEESEIYMQSENQDILIDNASFAPQVAGHFLFYAKYKGVLTSIIEIQAISDDILPKGDFFRRTLITKFTATWCVNCPKMSDAIKTVKKKNTNRIVDIAVHYIDDLEVPDGKNLAKQFSVSAIPVAVVNLDNESQTSVSSSTILQNYVDKAQASEKAASGIKLNSYEENDFLNVEIETTMAADGEYRLAVAIVQDEIQMAQTGAGSDYVHHSVLKGMLQDNTDGEDLGECSQGDVCSKQYQHSMNSLEKDGKYRLIAYVLIKHTDGSYTVNNVVSCSLMEKIDYQYESQNEN